MDENRIKKLREKKSAAQAELKEIGAAIEEVEGQLIEIMTEQECAGFKRSGSTFSLVIKEYPGAVPDCK